MIARVTEYSPLEWLGIVTASTIEAERVEAENVQIAAANERDEGNRPLLPVLTPEEYDVKLNREKAFSYATQHQQRMAQAALARIATLAPEQQAVVLTAMGLDYILAIADAQKRDEALAMMALPKYLALTREEKDSLVALVYPEFTNGA